jgi:hypothetical protein
MWYPETTVTVDVTIVKILSRVTTDAVYFDRLNNVTVHFSPFQILTESGDCGHDLFEILSNVSNVIPTQYGDYGCGLF